MAMARSVPIVVAPLLLLSVVVSTAAAARAVGGTVQDACSKTQFPKICADSLAAKPESQKATPRKLAELFVNIAADKGAKMSTFVQGKYNNNAGKKDDKLFVCYDSCSDDVEEAVAHLNGLLREPTDGKFMELKSWLSSTLGGTSTCEESCKDAPKGGDKDAVVNFSLDFEKLQRITLDLINEASGSMSWGIALPPSTAGAPSYGSAAPPTYGASSSGSDSASSDAPASSDAGTGSSNSEGPATSGPSSGGAAPAYGGSAASGPAADAPAGAASGPSGASAPSSSDSAGAPGPSSGGSSSAPASSGGSSSAPDSGDDDDDDDTNDSSS